MLGWLWNSHCNCEERFWKEFEFEEGLGVRFAYSLSFRGSMYIRNSTPDVIKSINTTATFIKTGKVMSALVVFVHKNIV